MNSYSRKKLHKGFTLIETLFAVLIFSTALISLMAISGRGVSATNIAKQQIVAQYLAQEGIEVVRNIRDSNFISNNPNWLDGIDDCTSSNPCNVVYGSQAPTVSSQTSSIVFQDANGFFQDIGDNSGYRRSIKVIQRSPNDYLVQSEVVWNTRTIERRVLLETIITRWR